MQKLELRVQNLEALIQPESEPIIIFVIAVWPDGRTRPVSRYSFFGGDVSPIDRTPGETDGEFQNRAEAVGKASGKCCLIFGLNHETT